MSFIDPLARRIERFVYDQVCALSELARRDPGDAPGADNLASPLHGTTSHHSRR